MKITKEIRDLFLFMSYGDGHISKSGYLDIQHCEKQKEYIEWKSNLIKPFLSNIGVQKFDNHGFAGYKFRTKTFRFLKLYRRVLYKPKKHLSRKLLNKLTPLGIYIWYMDDGGMSRKRLIDGTFSIKEIMLNTGLQKEDNQIIIDYFKKVWKINFSQVKNNSVYRLRCGKTEGLKFLNIFKEFHYSVKCMEYKIDPNSY